ncbi:related to Exocyst complex component Exo70 [Melanopsichium pennsylvanicum]|uniref:Exocyst complex protein EXO70 n=2 Tax=Melanopsichium pennsylvanicum TaxID=63383 RepID=A0AAJ4XIK2_9BASI|nr:related to Exocyst complex component Exo70 [Melanopsichium pennsylvanicum 4]SNX83029.1 related to Exocyst complex component Exo70 [Melanopsichium pennsylvanicum]
MSSYSSQASRAFTSLNPDPRSVRNTSSSNHSSNMSTSTVHDDNEIAFAELQMLSQNQRKLDNLTSRMTTILSGFDKRLIKLEGSILPIHKGTQRLARMSDNIDLTLAALNKTLGHYDVVIDEQPLLKQGPDVRDTRPYMDTIDRVIIGLEYLQKSDLKSQEGVMKRMSDLIELGAKNLCNVVTDWIRAESEAVDVAALSTNAHYPVLSEATHNAVVPILNYLSTLPRHPRTGYSPLSAGFAAYATVRSNYLIQSLGPLAAKLQRYALEKIGTGASGAGMVMVTYDDDEDHSSAYRRGEAGAVEMFEAYYGMLDNEYRILQGLVSSTELDKESLLLASAFSQLVSASLTGLIESLSTIQSHVRRHLATHTSFLLDMIGALSGIILTGRWDVLIRSMEDSPEAPLHSSSPIDKSDLDLNAGFSPAAELLEIYSKLKNIAIGIFPRFIEDVKAIPPRKATEVPSTSVNEITYLGLQFTRQITEYSDVVSPLLHTLGNGNWMMSSGVAPVLSLELDSDASKQSIVGDYLNDVLAVVLTSLEARSGAIRQPSTASVFLLNNIGHLRRTLSSSLPSFLGATEDGASVSMLSLHLGEIGDDLLNTALRQANAAYLDAWSPVISPLMEDQPLNAGAHYHRHATSKLIGVGGGSEKNQVKDRFAKFYEALDDLEKLHRAYPVSREDAELKESLRRDVTRLVCPMYARFLGKHKAGDFTKNPSKHIRMTEQEVEEKIASLFR